MKKFRIFKYFKNIKIPNFLIYNLNSKTYLNIRKHLRRYIKVRKEIKMISKI